MDRTGKIGAAIAFGILVTWMFYESTHQPPPNPAGTPSPTPALAGATPSPQASGSPTPGTVKPAGPPPAPEPVLPEETQEIDTKPVNFFFTNHGGGIASAQLNNDFVDDQSKKNIVLNEYGPAPIGAISQQPGIGADASYTTGAHGREGITYERTTPEQIHITKKFTLPTSDSGVGQYLTTLDLTFTNSGTQTYKSDGYYIYLGAAAPIHERDIMRYISMDWYRNGAAKTINVMSDFNARGISFLGIQWAAEKTENIVSADNIGWAGVYNQYFTTIITPSGGGGTGVWTNRIPIDVPTHLAGPAWRIGHPDATPTWYAINGALGMPGFDLKPGETSSKQFQIYVGRRQNEMLKHLDQGQAQILHMGYSAPISKLLLKLLIWLEKVVHSYAVAIILLTIGIKLLMWPLQNRSTQSMKRMQVLAPKMTELREKYKDDPVKYNQAMMKVYKDYGLSPWAPLAGCLPALIQLPIFVGFYSMLGSAIELRNSKFFWVHDLSQPDTVGHLFGYAINILPLCMAGTSAWMMSMTPKTGDAASQRMMYFMPLMFLWICYNYASGLALYMMVSNLFSVVQFILTKNQTAPVLKKLGGDARKKR